MQTAAAHAGAATAWLHPAKLTPPITWIGKRPTHLQRVSHKAQRASYQQKGHQRVGELQEELDDFRLLLGWGKPIETMLLLQLLGLHADGEGSAHGLQLHSHVAGAWPTLTHLLSGQADAALHILPVDVGAKPLCHLLGRQKMLIHIIRSSSPPSSSLLLCTQLLLFVQKAHLDSYCQEAIWRQTPSAPGVVSV